MKTLRFFMVGIMMLMAVCVTNAQSNEDFFVGTWRLEVTGMPQGDTTMELNIKRGEDGKLVGSIKKSQDAPIINLLRVEEKKESITAFFESNGYGCYLFAEKSGADEVEASFNDMFDAIGKKLPNATVEKTRKE